MGTHRDFVNPDQNHGNPDIQPPHNPDYNTYYAVSGHNGQFYGPSAPSPLQVPLSSPLPQLQLQPVQNSDNYDETKRSIDRAKIHLIIGVLAVIALAGGLVTYFTIANYQFKDQLHTMMDKYTHNLHTGNASINILSTVVDHLITTTKEQQEEIRKLRAEVAANTKMIQELRNGASLTATSSSIILFCFLFNYIFILLPD